MEIRYRQDIETIQVSHSAGICAATSSLQPSLLSHCCKFDPGSMPPSCHQLQYRTLPQITHEPSQHFPLLHPTSHLSRKCSSSSTSSTVHCLQDLSSLFRPLHLPVSILRAAVPPLSFAKTLLHLLQLPTTPST